MRLRIASILVRHGDERYPDALGKLDAFQRERLPNAVRTTIVVDNALPRREVRMLDRDVVLIGGDNGQWEFSGWDRGIAMLDRLRVGVDLVHFVTSAFDTLYTDFISRFDEALLARVAEAGAACGHLDQRGEAMELFGYASDHWIRTSFFFLPPSAVRSLQSMVSCEPGPEVFTPDPARPFADAAPLCDEFKRFVTRWLTGDGTGQGVEWHSRFDLDHETLDHFQRKAATIFNEALLTVRLRELGYPVVDVTWLADELAKKGVAAIDWRRNWRDQLAARL